MKKELDALVAAIEDAGPAPRAHLMEVDRLKRSWPSLYIAVMNVIKAHKEAQP